MIRPDAHCTGGDSRHIYPKRRIANREGVEEAFVADEWKVFALRLRDEHAVEWIPVVSDQAASTLCVARFDGKLSEALPGDARSDIGGHRQSTRQFADSRLGRDFPNGRRAHHDPLAEGERRIVEVA